MGSVSIIKSLYNQIDYLREKRKIEIKAQISKIPTKISVISVFCGNKTFEIIYAYNDLQNWYQYTELEKATTSREISFSWTKSDGSKINWDNVYLNFCRMKYTVLNLQYYGEDDSLGDNSLIFHYEDTPIEEVYKNYTYGDDQDDYNW